MSNLFASIQEWNKTQTDKTQAKITVSGIANWAQSFTPEMESIVSGKAEVPALPKNAPQWAQDTYSYVAATIKMNPSTVPSLLKDINADLNQALTDLTNEIGTFVAPPTDATPSQTAALANLSKIIGMAGKFPNNPSVQQIKGWASEMVGYVNKIGTEAIEGKAANHE